MTQNKNQLKLDNLVEELRQRPEIGRIKVNIVYEVIRSETIPYLQTNFDKENE